MPNPAAETSEPTSSGTFEPTVLDSRPETGPATSMPSVAGTRNRPACVTLAANPKPADFDCSTNCGTRMNEEYMPKPNSRAARFVVQTPRRRIICMSTTGEWLRHSHQIHTGISTAVATKSVRVLPEVQPQTEPSLIAM